jgi:hypothetical protein
MLACVDTRGSQAAMSAIKSLSTVQETTAKETVTRMEDKVTTRQWRAQRTELESLRAELKATKLSVAELTKAAKESG